MTFKYIFIIFIVLFFNACSNNSKNQQDNNTSEDNNPDNTTLNTNISGIVVDGYIQNALVCVDLNQNAKCDNEPSTYTNEKGEYSFEKVQIKSNKIIAIIAKDGTDTAIGETFDEVLMGYISTYDILNSYSSIVISPLSDLLVLEHIKNDFKGIFTASSADLSDPMKDKITFARVQKIQTLKAMIKSIDTSITNSDIKGAILEQALRLDIDNLDIFKAINTIENKYSLNISNNKKEYIKQQFLANKDIFQILSNEKNIRVEELASLQLNIRNDMKKVYDKIVSSSDDSNTSAIELDSLKLAIKNAKLILDIPKDKFYETPPLFPRFD